MAPSTATVETRAVDYSSEVIQKNPKKRWVSYIWDTFDKSPEERRLLFKLDAAILTFASLGKTAWMQISSIVNLTLRKVISSSTWTRSTLTMPLSLECLYCRHWRL